MRLRPKRSDHVRAYDFVEDLTRDGRRFRMLNVVDEFTRECLAVRVARKLGSADVIDVLAAGVAGGAPDRFALSSCRSATAMRMCAAHDPGRRNGTLAR